MLASLKLTTLKGVGPKQVEKLHRLGLFVVRDLLLHLPLRYQDKTRKTELDSIMPGQEALIEGEIFSQHLTQGRRSSLLVKIQSASGQFITLRFFHFHYRQAQQFSRGKTLRVFGEARTGPSGYEIVHPTYEFIDPDNPPPLDDTLTPTYPTTEGLGQLSLLKLIKQALTLLEQHPLQELLPLSLIKSENLPDLNRAIRTLHNPQPSDNLAQIKRFEHPAQQRLIIEELISHQVGLQLLRQAEKRRYAPTMPTSHMVNELIMSLPFELTNAQQRVLLEIQTDLKQNHPMQRLVQGDVGSGKTVIAALAAIQAADAGYQVAIMAPTEILAEQHKHAFLEWLAPLGLETAWLNGKMKVAEKRTMLAKIESGDAQVIIGTHALFQDAVTFNKLGLVIIDEQHRFGVHQRLALHEKGQGCEVTEDGVQTTHPHQLIMTATPIPRTLAMTAYGDLDLSVIDERPPGRQSIDTAVLSNEKRFEVMENLANRCAQGVQAYWVCPLIEESELLHAQAAEVTAEQFRSQWPNIRTGLIHGRLKGNEKVDIMNAFKAHELDLLVATTVIEVGVNVPNASLMIIENAERLGLAQLHQLRGRVGRGSLKSHCVLLYQAPLSETGKSRLKIMRETDDGFRIAEEDLRIRGPGEILGTRQTGGLQFRIADLRRDGRWIPLAQEWSGYLVETDHSAVQAIQDRWIGQNIDYQHA